jgi:hypothetical protein
MGASSVAAATRRKWKLFATLLLVLGAGSGALALLGGDGKGADHELTLELGPGAGGRAELLVSIPAAANAPSVSDGRPTVGLECRDARKRLVLESRLEWPFMEEAGFELPHRHQSIPAERAGAIASCRLTGTTLGFSGELTPVR